MALGHISYGLPLPAYQVIALWEGLLQICNPVPLPQKNINLHHSESTDRCTLHNPTDRLDFRSACTPYPYSRTNDRHGILHWRKCGEFRYQKDELSYLR